MTKVLVVLLCGLFCIGIVACGSSGGGGGAQPAAEAGQVIAGNWTWEETTSGKADGDTSTCTMVVAEEVIDGETFTTYSFSGEVNSGTQYGLAEWKMTPADEETLELLHAAKSISFKMLGDGRPYNVEIPISTVTDWGFHYRPIYTEAGQVQEHNIIFRGILQPPWAADVRFNQTRVTNIFVKTKNAAEGGLGPYSVKMWDLKLHM
jgi:hypothetical protein